MESQKENTSEKWVEETKEWMNEREREIAIFKDRLKHQCGTQATFVWMIVGLLLHLYYGKPLFSIYSLIFFILGMFITALIIGGINYILFWRIRPLMKLMKLQIIIDIALTWVGFKLFYQYLFN